MPPARKIAEHLELKINGTILDQTRVEGGWLVVDMKPEHLDFGENMLSLNMTKRLLGASEEIIIEKAEIHVRYNSRRRSYKTSTTTLPSDHRRKDDGSGTL